MAPTVRDDSSWSQTPATSVGSQYSTIQGDVEELIAIAAQLFCAVDVEIHSIETELLRPLGESTWFGQQTLLKERLIQVVTNLEGSLRMVGEHLGTHAELPEHARGS